MRRGSREWSFEILLVKDSHRWFLLWGVKFFARRAFTILPDEVEGILAVVHVEKRLDLDLLVQSLI